MSRDENSSGWELPRLLPKTETSTPLKRMPARSDTLSVTGNPGIVASYKALLEFWLYVHVPATFALIAALMAHIISVFFYW